MTAQQAIDLKAKLKAELLRRNGHGSVSTYGGSSYNFTTTPAKGQQVKLEHGQKTVDLFLKIKDYGNLMLSQKSFPIPSDFTDELIAEVDKLAAESKTGKSTEVSSCRGACTGLCVGSCHGNCNGCTGCTASCGTGCASGCNTGCGSGCVGNCKGSCNTGCSTGCSTACTGATAATAK